MYIVHRFDGVLELLGMKRVLKKEEGMHKRKEIVLKEIGDFGCAETNSPHQRAR